MFEIASQLQITIKSHVNEPNVCCSNAVSGAYQC